MQSNFRCYPKDFNPRFREGSDAIHTGLGFDLWIFQSTLPRRKRLRFSLILQLLTVISIHASAKEATINFPGVLNNRVFQSTLPRRKRQARSHSDTFHNDFNPRFREGSDSPRIVKIGLYLFQSTLPRRKRRHRDSDTARAGEISIHASAKEATADMYNFLVYICKNHSTTYKLIIVLLFHTVKQIKYSYWKKCESICIFMYTCDSHLTLSGLICIHPFHHWLRFDGENLVYYEAIINQYSTPKS